MAAFLRASVVGLALLWITGPAYADPIRVTTGTVSALWFGGDTHITIGGDGLLVDWPNAFGAATTTWTIGTLGDLDGSFALENPPGDVLRGVVVNGVPYLVDILVGSLEFTTDRFLIQPPDPGQTAEAFNAAFTMTGALQGLNADGETLFNVSLFGTGRAHASPATLVGDSYVLRGGTVDYSFEAAAPTPEPATMLLLSTGLLGALLRRRLV